MSGGVAILTASDDSGSAHPTWTLPVPLRDVGKGAHYLRRSVLNRSRSVLRHRAVAGKHLLSEEQVAAAMQISQGAVKSHTARGNAALRSLLEPERQVSRFGPAAGAR